MVKKLVCNWSLSIKADQTHLVRVSSEYKTSEKLLVNLDTGARSVCRPLSTYSIEAQTEISLTKRRLAAVKGDRG